LATIRCSLPSRRVSASSARVQGLQQQRAQRLGVARQHRVLKRESVDALGRRAGPGGEFPGVEAIAPAAIDIKGDLIQMQAEHHEHALGGKLVPGRALMRFGFFGQARAVLLVQRQLALQLLARAAVLLNLGAEALLVVHRLGRAPCRAPAASPGGTDQRQHRCEQDATEKGDPLPVEVGEEHREQQQQDQEQREQRRQHHAQQRSQARA